jgi:hypothetical protein
MAHKLIGPIRPEDVGKPHEALGVVQARDVGKLAYDVDGVVQVENEEQFKARTSKQAAGFTAGPWRTTDTEVYDTQGRQVANCPAEVPYSEAEANARLVAAAPDLYAALEAARDKSPCIVSASARNIDRERCECSGCVVMRTARAALARARGEG